MDAGKGWGPSGCFGSGVCIGAWTASPGDRPRCKGPLSGTGFPLPHVGAGGAEQAQPLLMPAAPPPLTAPFHRAPPPLPVGAPSFRRPECSIVGARKPGQPTLPRPAQARPPAPGDPHAQKATREHFVTEGKLAIGHLAGDTRKALGFEAFAVRTLRGHSQGLHGPPTPWALLREARSSPESSGPGSKAP